jgi:hypothetical protein
MASDGDRVAGKPYAAAIWPRRLIIYAKAAKQFRANNWQNHLPLVGFGHQ